MLAADMLSDLLMLFCLQRGLTLRYWWQLLDQIWRRMLKPKLQGPLQTNPTDHLNMSSEWLSSNCKAGRFFGKTGKYL